MKTQFAAAIALASLLAPVTFGGERYTRNVAVVIYDGVEVLDFAGPAEVLAIAAGYGAAGDERAYNMYTVSRSKKPIVSQGFIDVLPDYSIEDSPVPDLLIIPGGSSAAITSDPAFLAWVKASGTKAETVLTVCTGAFVAAQAGLLEGAEATTWYGAVERLAAAFPSTRVHPGRRFVDNGKLITTAGVSAGIDGALHLVARTLGRYVADRTAQYMEYRWAPESYHSAEYALLNPRLDGRGRRIQQGTIELEEGSSEHALATFQALIEADEGDSEAWLGLGYALHGLGRYEDAIAAHQKAAASDPARGAALFNIARAHARLGRNDEALEFARRAVEAGYVARWRYEQDPDLAALRDDPRFRALVGKL